MLNLYGLWKKSNGNRVESDFSKPSFIFLVVRCSLMVAPNFSSIDAFFGRPKSSRIFGFNLNKTQGL